MTSRTIGIGGWTIIPLQILRLLSSVITITFLIYMSFRLGTDFILSYVAAVWVLVLDIAGVFAIIHIRSSPSRSIVDSHQVAASLLGAEDVALGLLLGSMTFLLSSYSSNKAELQEEPYGTNGAHYYENPIEKWRSGAVILQGIGAGLSFICCILNCVGCWRRSRGPG